MAFQILNFTSVVASLINHVRGTTDRLTDFNIGSVVRTILEAVGVVIDELYQQMFNGLREAMPVATYNSFNFARLDARSATGHIRVVITSSGAATVIQAGTVFTSDVARTSYISQSDVVIAAGATFGDVSVVAASTGVLGNIPEGTAFEANPRPSAFVSASNALPLSNGRNLETDDERLQRFGDYVTTLQRSTYDSLKVGARTVVLYNSSGVEIERVKAVSVVEPWTIDPEQPFALVEMYVHNGAGGTSADLVGEAVKVIHGYKTPAGVKVPGWKAAGVKVVVAAAVETPLDITGVITPMPGYVAADLITAARASLQRYILDLDIGEAFLFSQAVVLVSSIPGVANIVFSAPTADQAIDDKRKFMPGLIEVTAA